MTRSKKRTIPGKPDICSKLLQEADKQAKQIVEKAYSQIAKEEGYKVQVQLADK